MSTNTAMIDWPLAADNWSSFLLSRLLESYVQRNECGLRHLLYSPSPHSMKGLMIGTFFAIRGAFQLLGALVFIFPFLAWKSTSSFPSCGFVYYLVNMIVTFLGLIAFIAQCRNWYNQGVHYHTQ